MALWAVLLGFPCLALLIGLVLRITMGSKKAGQIGFNLVMMSSVLPPYFLCLVGKFYFKRGTQDEQKRRRATFQNILIMLTCICWRVGLTLCFWISVDVKGISEFRSRIGTTGRPVCVIANHTSFLDIFLSVTMFPLRKVGEVKMIVSDHVFKMPIMGLLAKTMGHLSVPFKAHGDGAKFDVDKDALAIVMEQYEQHLKDGHACAWFPEGQVNRADCSKLQQFRAGGMGIAVRSDVEVWCIAMVGNAVSWPGPAPLGGNPANIAGQIVQLCESSKAFLAAEDCGKDEREKGIYLANTAQKKIQDIIDGIVTKGVKAGDNTKRKKEDVSDGLKKD